MKKIFMICTLAIVASSAAFAQTWSLDKASSKLGFSITHMKFSEVDGYFQSFDLKVISLKTDFSDAVIELTANTSTINTQNSMRDKHLKGEDYFDVEKFPVLNFKSTSIKKTSTNNYTINGILTMHGVSKAVNLTATLKSVTEHPISKKNIASFNVIGDIKRLQFSVGKKSSILSDNVKLNADFQLIKN